MSDSSPRSFADAFALHFARLGFAGLSPKAPGTAGSALAVVLAPWLFLPLPLLWRVVLLVALYFIGAWAATRAEMLLGRQDPGSVVIDELVGQWITLLPLCLPLTSPFMPEFAGASFGPAHAPLIPLLIGFALFRLFDITKPGIIGRSEKWYRAGYGIMIDDVLGGIAGMLWLCAFCAVWRMWL